MVICNGYTVSVSLLLWVRLALCIALLVRDVIYTSRAYATSQCPSVCSSVCDGSALVHYS